MCGVIAELTENGAAKKRAGEWSAKPGSLDADQFVKDITVIGKGRFAQRLASIITKDICPNYIRNAITYVAERC